MDDNQLKRFRANDPREKPIYINVNCEECNTALVLFDKFNMNKYSEIVEEPLEGTLWYDEWVCPRCQDGILMDWPR